MVGIEKAEAMESTDSVTEEDAAPIIAYEE